MTRRQHAMLERAFAAEVDGALRGGPGLYQTRSIEARKLAEAGYLVEETVRLGDRFPVTIRGYGLTHLGRWIYCADLPDA